MGVMVKLRRGEGPFWGPLKRLILRLLRWHIPVVGVLRPLFGFLYLVHVGVGLLAARGVRFLWYEPLFRSQCCRIGSGFNMEHMPYINGSGRIILGDDVRFGGKPDFVFGNRGERTPEVAIGNNTFIGHQVSFAVSDSVCVGDNCLIASGVQVSDYDGHPLDAAARRAGAPTPPENIRPVVIGNDVWIGNNAIILKGVRVGDRAVVGAGAVVTRDVPPDTVVAGNPARVVKQLPAPHGASLAVPDPAKTPAAEEAPRRGVWNNPLDERLGEPA